MRHVTTVLAVLIALGAGALAITPARASRVAGTAAHSVVDHDAEHQRLLLLRAAEQRRRWEVRRRHDERAAALRQAEGR